MEFCIHGFRPSNLKFPRAETFSTMAKLSGTKFSLTEMVSFDSDSSDGGICLLFSLLLRNCVFEQFF